MFSLLTVPSELRSKGSRSGLSCTPELKNSSTSGRLSNWLLCMNQTRELTLRSDGDLNAPAPAPGSELDLSRPTLCTVSATCPPVVWHCAQPMLLNSACPRNSEPLKTAAKLGLPFVPAAKAESNFDW